MRIVKHLILFGICMILLLPNYSSSAIYAGVNTTAPLDIVLVQDETGSMGDDILALKALAPQIWDSILSITGSDFRMGVVGFRDYARSVWGGSTDWVYRRLANLTQNRSEFISNVNLLTAAAGGDGPESHLSALGYLLNYSAPCIDSNGNGNCLDAFDTPPGQQPSFRAGTTRVILLATDASFHSPINTSGYPGPTLNDIVDALQRNHAILIGLVPGGEGKIPDVDYLANQTGGSVHDTGATGGEIASAILNALQGIQSVDANASMVFANPTNAPADGKTSVAVTIVLRDMNGQPIAGKKVVINSSRGEDIITQPVLRTNIYGYTLGFVSSYSPGNSNISVVEVGEGIRINQQASLVFIQPPEPELVNCIDSAINATIQEMELLVQQSEKVKDDGYYFASSLSEDEAKAVFDLLWSAVDFAIPATEYLPGKVKASMSWLSPGWNNPDWGFTKLVKREFPKASNYFDRILNTNIASGGFKRMPQKAWNEGFFFLAANINDQLIEETTTEAAQRVWRKTNNDPNKWKVAHLYISESSQHLEEALRKYRNVSFINIPADLSTTEQKYYANDICKRAAFSVFNSQTAIKQAELIHNLRGARESNGWIGPSLFVAKFLGRGIGLYLADGAGSLISDGVFSSIDLLLDGSRISVDKRGLGAAYSFYNTAPRIARQNSSNVTLGLDLLTNHREVKTVQGAIQNITHHSEGASWASLWKEQASYSNITVKNTSDSAARYIVQVQFDHTLKNLGMQDAYATFIAQKAITLNAGQTGTVRIDYKQEEKGGSPDKGSMLHIALLGANDDGIYFCDQNTSAWVITSFSTHYDPSFSPDTPEILIPYADTPIIENPIDAYLYAEKSDNIYYGNIYVVNPFTGTLQAQITQPIPVGASVLSTNGSVSGSNIQWDRSIYTSDLISVSYTIRYPSDPGSIVQMPPAALSFPHPVTGIAMVANSNASEVIAPWPIQLTTNIPVGRPGISSQLPVTITNISDASSNGIILANLIDSNNLEVYRQEQSFNLVAHSSGKYNFQIPGNLPIGVYNLSVDIRIGANHVNPISDFYFVKSAFYLPIIQLSQINGVAPAQPTPLPSRTPTLTATATSTYMPTATRTATPTRTNTPLATATSTPTATNTPTNTATPTLPPAAVLLGPFINNGGFESGNMSGWTSQSGTFDIATDFAHSGAYYVRGTSSTTGIFYRNISLTSYSTWINAGRATASYEGWLHDGNSEQYRYIVTFYNSSGTPLYSYDTNWVSNPDSNYHRHGESRTIPAGTAYVRIEVQMNRTSGSYTDVDVDDLYFAVSFSY